jgi:hypothetical protein
MKKNREQYKRFKGSMDLATHIVIFRVMTRHNTEDCGILCW